MATTMGQWDNTRQLSGERVEKRESLGALKLPVFCRRRRPSSVPFALLVLPLTLALLQTPVENQTNSL